ncbi:tyrosine-type recombinase/integrase [Micromonospora sp. NPDC000316]|uniref:tyrosine-type recombinase/integrase n=1 Tax=Micromonospora sp. NPDC000316 TaxID=3364216 RepID=UPI0036805803
MPVDDLWYLNARGPDGARVPSKRHGRGKRWRVRWTDNLGETRTQLFERKVDADRHDANVRADLSRGQYIDDRAGRITVAALASLWRDAQLHTDSTTVRVEHAVRLHVLPGLGAQQIKDVRPSHIQAWVRDRSTVLAPTTLRVVYTYLSSMFAMAVRDRLISASPCDKGIRLPPVSRGSRVLPTAEQVHDLARLLPARLAAMVYLAAGCGLRLGEILGLEVDDIDFDVREVHVRRQLKVLKGRQPFLGPVKTSTSARTVELPDVVVVALRQHLADGCDAVEVDDDTDRRRSVRRAARLLFKGVGGEPVNAATFSRTWASAREAVGLPARWGIHGLRHYYATVLIHAGASVKTVQLALGHSTPTITLNTYVHEWPDVLDRTRLLIDGALGRHETAATPAVSRA